MIPIEDLMKNDLAKGLAIGAGVALLVPLAALALAPVMRPVARAAFKSGVIALEKGRETLAEIGEVMDDLAAEARSELRDARLSAEETVSESRSTPEQPGG